MPVRGVLLDVGGVVFVGDTALPGAIAAVEQLKAAGIAIRCVTNTTRQPRRLLLEKLNGFGLNIRADELFMPATAAHRHLVAHGLTPHLLVHPALAEDFAGLRKNDGPKAVVIGDAAQGFTYDALNGAFRALNAGAEFLALARNRSFRDADGGLSLDAGPFIAALEFATGREALILGKPSPDFFASAIDSLGCDVTEAVMIGDDTEADIGGAQTAGITGILVRTGKYQPGDEGRIDPPPAAVVENLPMAAKWILARADL